jgi:hypothetical protein
MKTLMLAMALGLLALTLNACGEDPVDNAIVDTNQVISKENATLNCNDFMREAYGAEFERCSFMSDSTIGPACRYGDGWASGKGSLKDGSKLELKCQTNGSGKGSYGCLTTSDFANKDYAKADGKCDDTLTSLKKLGG